MSRERRPGSSGRSCFVGMELLTRQLLTTGSLGCPDTKQKAPGLLQASRRTGMARVDLSMETMKGMAPQELEARKYQPGTHPGLSLS